MSDRTSPIPDRSNSERLARLLEDLAEIEEGLRAIDAFRISGVPGRKPEHALEPTREEDSAQLAALQERRAAVLELMAREVVPVGRWVRHRGALLYLAPLPQTDTGPENYELHELLSEDAFKWIPTDVPESPWITERRVLYAMGEGENDPFEEVTPGTGEPSPRVVAAREEVERREREEWLRAVAPEARSPLKKTHDYEYEYAGFFPGAPWASCRVRIYQEEVGRREPGSETPPVVVLSQDLTGLGGVSLTNLIEAVSAEVVLSSLPNVLVPRRIFLIAVLQHGLRRPRLRQPPVRVIEHYSKGYTLGSGEPGDREGENFAVITFSSYKVQAPLGLPETENVPLAGEEEYTLFRGNRTERLRFGQPEWHHVGRTAAERMVGQKL